MANKNERGKELVYLGFIDTKDECLLEILKNNGFYLQKRNIDKFCNSCNRDAYIILFPKED